MMALLTTVETTSPTFRLIGHSDYGDVIAFIIYLTRIELGSRRRIRFSLLRLREVYLSVPYGIRSRFIVRQTLSTVVACALIMAILVMGLRRSVCQITGILLLPYLL